MKRAAGYIRVSKFDGEGVSPTNQEEKIKLQAKLLGVDLIAIHTDLDVSGKNTDRPEFQRMVEGIKAKKYDYIIVYKLSRFSRSTMDFHLSMLELERYNVTLVSVSENIDTGTPVGRLIRNVLVDFAQFERETIAEQIRDNMYANAKIGNWNGGVAPFGYKAENGKLVPGENADIIRWIIQSFADGRGANVIRNDLFNQGISSPNGRKYWHKNTIREMARNPVYIGKIEYGGNLYDGIHEPLVKQEVWDAAQQVLKERSERAPRVLNSVHLLSGLIKCPICGRAYNIRYNGRKDNRVRRYMCPNRNDGVQACAGPIIDADGLESCLVDTLFSMAKDPEVFLQGARKAVKSITESQQQKLNFLNRYKTIEKRLNIIKRAMKDLFRDYYEEKHIPRSQFDEINNSYLEEERLLKEELQKLKGFEVSARQVQINEKMAIKALMNFSNNWDVLTVKERRDLVGSIVSKIEIRQNETRVWILEYPLDIASKEIRRGTMIF